MMTPADAGMNLSSSGRFKHAGMALSALFMKL